MKRTTLLRPLLLLLLISLTGCLCSPKNSAPHWTKKQVQELKMLLEDPVDYEWLSFTKGGDVSITFGKKNGPLCAPLFYWRLRKGVLVIKDDEQKPFKELHLISQKDGFISAHDQSGKILRYRVLTD